MYLPPLLSLHDSSFPYLKSGRRGPGLQPRYRVTGALITAWIRRRKTTDCTYEIIITNAAVSDFTGDAGLFRFDTVYRLAECQATAVSDYYPVYAEFLDDGDMD